MSGVLKLGGANIYDSVAIGMQLCNYRVCNNTSAPQSDTPYKRSWSCITPTGRRFLVYSQYLLVSFQTGNNA